MRGRLGQGKTICPAITVGKQRCTVLHCVTGREDQDMARALQHYRQSLVTLCSTALLCVTSGKDQDRDLQYHRQSLVTLCYRLGGPGQSVTVLPPVTGYTVTLRYRRGGPGQGVTVLPGVIDYTVLHCYRRGGPRQGVTVLPAVTGGTQTLR